LRPSDPPAFLSSTRICFSESFHPWGFLYLCKPLFTPQSFFQPFFTNVTELPFSPLFRVYLFCTRVFGNHRLRSLVALSRPSPFCKHFRSFYLFSLHISRLRSLLDHPPSENDRLSSDFLVDWRGWGPIPLWQFFQTRHSLFYSPLHAF